MNEFINNATTNFKEQREGMLDLSICDIIKAYDYIHTLSQFIDSNNEVLDELGDVLRPFENIISKCRTEKVCPHCGGYLYKSDVPQYDYVCVDCDENFYECEVGK